MKIIKFSFVFLLLLYLSAILILVSCSSRSVGTEKEVNDTQKLANNIFPDKKIRGVISSENDVDFFVLNINNRELEKSKIIIADINLLSQEKCGLKIDIMNRGRLIKTIVGEKEIRLVNAGFSIDDVQNQRIYLSVSAQKGSPIPVSYTLDIKAHLREDGEEYEPDDQPVFAIDVSDNEIITGYFNPASNPLNSNGNLEEDWFKYRVTEEKQNVKGGRRIKLNLSPVPDVDSQISIYDDLGYKIREGDSFGLGEGENLMNVFLPIGTYFIKVSSIKRGEQNYKIPYRFKITGIDSSNTELEPNDTYPKANSISLFSQNRGVFNPVGDVDWYKLNIYDSIPQIVTIKVEPAAFCNIVLGLYNGSGVKLISVDDRGIDEGEIIKNIGLEAGVYFIKIENSAQKKDQPQSEYSFSVTKRNWERVDEFELNNEFDRANRFYIGELKKGYITPVGDVDYYYFMINNKEKLRFELTPCVLLDNVIEVYDNGYNLIATFDERGEGEGEVGTATFEAGVYYAKIYCKNKVENPRDNYILKIFPVEVIDN